MLMTALLIVTLEKTHFKTVEFSVFIYFSAFAIIEAVCFSSH